jgi:hypothetical protein
LRHHSRIDFGAAIIAPCFCRHGAIGVIARRHFLRLFAVQAILAFWQALPEPAPAHGGAIASQLSEQGAKINSTGRDMSFPTDDPAHAGARARPC